MFIYYLLNTRLNSERPCRMFPNPKSFSFLSPGLCAHNIYKNSFLNLVNYCLAFLVSRGDGYTRGSWERKLTSGLGIASGTLQSRIGKIKRSRAEGMTWPPGLCFLCLAAHVSIRREIQQTSFHLELPSSPVSVVGLMSGCVCSGGDGVCRLGVRALLRSPGWGWGWGRGEHPGPVVWRLEWSSQRGRRAERTPGARAF